LISTFPSGQQAIAYQCHAISLELMTAWRGYRAWSNKLVSSLGLGAEKHELRSLVPFVDLLKKLWAIIERLDPEESALERLICITQYITVIRQTYVKIVYKSTFFQTLQADASKVMVQFQPRTRAEFECFVSNSMYVINSWKTEAKLVGGGLCLLRSMKHRFPEMRQWESILDILQRFLIVPPYLAEWRDDWLQSCSYE
jgi:hypothetical protein